MGLRHQLQDFFVYDGISVDCVIELLVISCCVSCCICTSRTSCSRMSEVMLGVLGNCDVGGTSGRFCR